MANEDFARAIVGRSVHTRPTRNEKDYYAEEEAKLSWSIDQAVSRGMLDEDVALEAKTNNDRTWWDKMWGFEKSSRNMFGPVPQAAIDALSIGNYASAALSQATIKDPLINIGGLKIGATPSAWYREFKKRPYYTDMFDSFGAGLFFDIALDPVTYLTFGVGAGVKVGTQGVKKVGMKLIPEGAKALTLTRYGEKIYRVAARKLAPNIEKIVSAETAKLVADGKTVGYMAHSIEKLNIHELIGKEMISNYEQLAMLAAKEEGMWTKFVSGTGRAAEQAKLPKASAFAQSAEDMFRETARGQFKDVGTSFKTLNSRIVAIPVIGDGFRAIAPNFNRSYGVTEDVLDVWHLTKNSITTKVAESNNAITKAFRGFGLNDDEIRLATMVAESGDVGMKEGARHINGRIIDDLVAEGSEAIPQRVKEAAIWTRNRFNEILKTEQEFGIKIESLKDYVHRSYSTDAARTLRLNSLSKHLGISDFSSPKGFQMHRAIAHIDDAIEEFGKGFVETNLATLAMKREAASIRLIEMNKFYDYLKSTSGMTPLLVYKATNEAIQTEQLLKKIIKNQGPDEIMIDFDQLYAKKEGLHKRLGFVLNETVYKAGGMKKNVDLLDYLSLSSQERFLDTASDLTKRVKPNAAAEVSDKLQRTFSLTVNGSKIKTDAPDILRAIYTDGSDPILQTAVLFGKQANDVRAGDVKRLMLGLDKWSRTKLGIPILHIFPDLLDTYKNAALTYGTKRFTKVDAISKKLVPKAHLERALKNLSKDLKKAFGGGSGKNKSRSVFVPKLPEELILRGRLLRMRYGDYGDVLKPTGSLLSEAVRLRKKLGMTGENLSDVISALHGKKRLSSLSAREADQLVEFLGIHANEYGKLHGKKSAFITGESVRPVEFGKISKPFFEKIDSEVSKGINEFNLNQAKITGEIKAFERSVSSVRKQISSIDESLTKLENGLDAIKTSGTPEEIAIIADKIKDLTKARIALLQAADGYSQLIIKGNKKISMSASKLPLDERQFIPIKEVIKRNGESLSKREMSLFASRAGVARSESSIRSLIPSSMVDEATKIKRTAKKKTADLEKRAVELAKKRDELPSVGPGSLRARAIYEKGIAVVEQQKKDLLRDTEDALKSVFDSKVKLIDGGRYIDPDGVVRDILVVRSSKGKKTISGKWADEIRKAVVSDVVINNRKLVSYLTPAVRDELPEAILGASSGRYYLPKSLANFIEEVKTPLYSGQNEMVDMFLRKFDRVQNMFKVPILAPWMSTMSRNSIGNVALAYLKAGISLFKPSYLSDYVKAFTYVWAKESPLFRSVYMGTREMTPAIEKKLAALGDRTIKTEFGKEVKISELIENFSGRGVMTAWMRDEVFDVSVRGGKSDRLLGGLSGAGIGGSIGGIPGAGIGAAIGALTGKEAYKMKNLFRFQELASELPTRIMLGIHSFKKGASFDEVGRIVRHHLHDYSELSTFEKRFVRRMMPFYNFTKLALRTAATSVIEHPGRVLQPSKIFNAYNTNPIWGETAMPEDIPDWFHNQMVFMSRDYDPDTGKLKTTVVNGFNLPIQEVLNLSDIVGPGGKPISSLASRGPFGAKSALEYIFNYDTFSGGPIRPDIDAGIKTTRFQSGRQFEGAPDWLKTLVGYKTGDDGKAVVNPKMAWLLGQLPHSRFISVTKKIYDVNEEDAKSLNYNTIARNLIGVSVYRYDAKTGKYYRDIGRINAMSNVLANIQVLKSMEIDSTSFKKETKRRRTSSNTSIGNAFGGR